MPLFKPTQAFVALVATSFAQAISANVTQTVCTMQCSARMTGIVAVAAGLATTRKAIRRPQNDCLTNRTALDAILAGPSAILKRENKHIYRQRMLAAQRVVNALIGIRNLVLNQFSVSVDRKCHDFFFT